MNDKPHVSSSQIEMFYRCGEQYRRRYIEREIIPPGIALITGTGYHRGAETNFRQKIESHQDLPKSDIVGAAVAAFEAETKHGSYLLSQEEASRGAGIVLGEAKDQTAVLAGVYAERQAPDYQPVAVEHATRIELPKATHDLLAITDLRDDQGRVVDLKTSAKKKPQSEADASLQLTVYAAAFEIENGVGPEEVRLDVVTKTKKPDRQVLRSTRNWADYAALVERINTMLAVVSAGNFPPAPIGAWYCSPRFCGYFRAGCPYVNSERLAAAERNQE